MLYADLPPRIHESLKILVCLAHKSDPSQAQEVAAQTGLPPAQTAKILQSLARAGFLESRRGTHGGFWLSQPAGRIHIADVIAFFTRPRGPSPAQEQDPLIRVLMRALAPCQRQFDEITLDALARETSHQPHDLSRSARKSLRIKGQQETVPATRRRVRALQGAKS